MTTIWIDESYAGESDGSVLFRLRRIGPTEATDSVQYRTVNHYAAAGADFVGQTGTVVFAPGETERFVEIALIDDTNYEYGEAFELELFDASEDVLIGRSGAYAVILDDDAPPAAPYIRAVDAAVNEVEDSVTVWFALERPAPAAFTIEYATADAYATAGSDYVATSGVLSFAQGDVVKSVTIDLIDDAVAEPIESFRVELSNAVGTPVIGAAPAEVRIFDADGPPPTTPFLYVDPDASESAAVIGAIFVLRYSPNVFEQLLAFQFLAEVADAITDFSPDFREFLLDELVEFGWTVFPLPIAIFDDPVDDETRAVTVLAQMADEFFAASSHTAATVYDDEGLVVFPYLSVEDACVNEGSSLNPAGPQEGTVPFWVGLSAPANYEISFDFATHAASAEANVDFVSTSGRGVIPPREMGTWIWVNLGPDVVAEQAEQFTLNVTDIAGAYAGDTVGVGTIHDDDHAAGGHAFLRPYDRVVGENELVAPFQLMGHLPADQQALLEIRATEGSAGADDAVVPRLTGHSVGHGIATYEVLLRDDAVPEGSESLVLEFEAYSPTLIARSSTTLTVIDNDGYGPTRYYLMDARVDESDGVGEIVVLRLGNTSQSGSVVLQLGSGSAAVGTTQASEPDADLWLPSDQNVFFMPGESVRRITFLVNEDGVPEPDELAATDLVNPVGGYIADGEGTILIAATADPPPPGGKGPGIFVLPAAIDEAAPFVVVELRLTAPSDQPVEVDFETLAGTAGAPDDFVGINGHAVFLPGQMSVAVRVPIRDDAVVEPDETFTMRLSDPVNATLAQGGVGTVRIVDNDSPPPTGLPLLSIADASADENVGLLDFVVTLSQPSTEVVKVGYASADDTALDASDYAAVNGVLWFAPGEVAKTVRVPVIDDTIAEADERFDIILLNPQGAALADPQGVGTILANDVAPAAPTIASVEDDIGPLTGAVAPGETTDDRELLVSGTTLPDITVDLFDGPTWVGRTVSDGAGSWSLTTPAFPDDGPVDLGAIAVSDEGVPSLRSPAYPVIIDTTPPAAPTIDVVIDDVGPSAGSVPRGGFTDDTQPLVGGSAEPGSLVSVFDGSTLLRQTVADQDGHWSLAIPLFPDALTLRATATDAAGNTSGASQAFPFTIATLIAGTTGDDALVGTPASDLIEGLAGRDTLTGGAGDDGLDGGPDIDVAWYAALRADAGISLDDSGIATIETPSEGRDTARHVERVHCADGSVAIDFVDGALGDGAAAIVAKILGAVFGPASVANAEYAGIGLYYLDQGFSYEALMAFALDARLGSGYSNADEISLFYQNLLGLQATPDDIAFWGGQIGPGGYTQASLGVFAADTEFNVINIDLAGLRQVGLDYVQYTG